MNILATPTARPTASPSKAARVRSSKSAVPAATRVGAQDSVSDPLRRRRGRPPKGSQTGASTTERLLQSAADVFIEVGFESSTVSDIAQRADVTANAIYNHFTGRDELLLAAIRRELAVLPKMEGDIEDITEWTTAIVKRWLAPGCERGRRLLTEAQAAAPRHAELAGVVHVWQDQQARDLVDRLPGRLADRRAAAKAFLLLISGIGQMDGYALVSAATAATTDALVRAALAILAPPAPATTPARSLRAKP